MILTSFSIVCNIEQTNINNWLAHTNLW